MKKFNNQYSQKVYEIIEPLLGDLMTQNVLKVQTKKIGKDIETLTDIDIPKLAEAIGSGLAIFLGADGAKNIALKILNIR